MNTLRVLAALTCGLGTVQAQHVGVPTDDLEKLSVEELFRIQVTSVGRKAQQLSKAPAAAFVLTADDIRRSGATSIPEALRWVPGLTVLRTNGRSWVVSARGSARLYSDKILVMIDGRSLYNPLFSGLIWDSIDVLLEDVERIEIVRGPGAVMWGPNAVNGVINIITKRAQASRGGLASVEAGNERHAAKARWGGAPSDRFAYRVWGQASYDTPGYGSPAYFSLANDFTWRDASVSDLDWATTRLGFRLDAQSGRRDKWMFQGDLFQNDRQDPSAYGILLPVLVERVQGHTGYEGGHLHGRWTRTASEAGESVLQLSYDRMAIDYPFIAGTLNNLTVDFQRRRPLGENNEVYWGVGYQQYWDSIFSRRFGSFDPPSSVYRVGDVVLRDEWQIARQRLLVSAGVRVDYNSYRRAEFQPSIRLLFTPNTRESLWIAASRAVRAPSRFDRDIQVDNGMLLTPAGIPLSLRFAGSPGILSETARSLEAGYRRQSGQRWSVDGSVFWTYYSRLRALEGPLQPELILLGQSPALLLQMRTGNAGAGRAYGGEVWGTWQVRSGWRLIPSYSYLSESRWLPASTSRLYEWDGRPATLHHQGWLRSQHELSRTLQLDLMARARSRDLTWNLPGVLLVDARLGWRPTRSTELSVTVQNLSDRNAIECYSEGPTPAIPFRRTFVAKWTQRF